MSLLVHITEDQVETEDVNVQKQLSRPDRIYEVACANKVCVISEGVAPTTTSTAGAARRESMLGAARRESMLGASPSTTITANLLKKPEVTDDPTDILLSNLLPEKGKGTTYKAKYTSVAYDGAVSDDPNSSAPFFSEIAQTASKRHNILLINRGCQDAGGDSYYPTVVRRVIEYIAPTTEHALQLVADELAKEKQMQRLMMTEDDLSNPSPGMAPKPPPTEESSQAQGTKVPPVTLSLLELAGFSPAAPSSRRPFTASGRGRFFLLNGAIEDALVPPKMDSKLVSRAFVARPPSGYLAKSARGPARSLSFTEKGSPKNRDQQFAARKKSMQFQRKSSVLLLQQLTQVHNTDVSPRSLPHNGWDSMIPVFQFGNTPGFISLPGIPNLEGMMKQFSIDFWMKTATKISDGRQTLFHIGEGHRPEVGMLMHIALHWYTDQEDHMRFFVRDAANRVLEVLIPISDIGLTNGLDFHHYQIVVKNLEEGSLEVRIDGRVQERLRFMQSEHPSVFNSWNHRIFIGGFVDDNENILLPFTGSVMELRLWKHHSQQPPKVVVRWPLLAPADGGNLVEATKAIGEDHVCVIHGVDERRIDAPKCCPTFDGSIIVNMGQLGSFGDFLYHFGIEIRFKTKISKRPMALLGVTDSQHRMAEMAIILNAEPALTQERFKFREYNITLILRDMTGRSLVGIVRGTERSHCMDDKWHTLTWKVVDSEMNKMEARIDGTNHDVLIAVKEGPKNFLPFRNWICLGGHNVRDTKVKHSFEGYIQMCQVTMRGEPFVHLDLDEGPGATIACDCTGHGYHAVFQSTTGKCSCKHSIMWSPVHDEESKDAEAADEEQVEVFIHKNNAVKYAVINFTAAFQPNGKLEETAVDVLHDNKALEIDLMPSDLGKGRQSESRGFCRMYAQIPDEAFITVEQMEQLKVGLIETTEKTCQSSPGHLLVVVAIGDAKVAVMNLRGPLLPMTATYNLNMMRWQSPLSTFGLENKRNRLLNSMIAAVDKALTEVSVVPNVTRQLGPEAIGPLYMADNLISALGTAGLPWKLASVAFSILMDVYIASSLFVSYTLWGRVTEDEAASMVLAQRALVKSALPRAANLIQRNWRGKMARDRTAKMSARREQRRKMVSEILELRQADPRVLPKTKLNALVVTMLQFQSPSVCSIESSESKDVADLLEKNGYQVNHLENPTPEQLIEAVEALPTGSMNFVFITGFGGKLRFCRPTFPSFERLLFLVKESYKRTELETQCFLQFYGMKRDLSARIAAIRREKELQASSSKKKKGVQPAPPRVSKQQQAAQEQQARVAEETLRAALDDLQREEADARVAAVYREYDFELNQIAYEYRRVIVTQKSFDENFGNLMKPVVVCSNAKTCEATPESTTRVEDIVQVALKGPKAPLGYQCVVAVDLQPFGRNDTGYAFVGASCGQFFETSYLPLQHNVLTWQLRKALQGNVPQLPLKDNEAILRGAVRCDETQRDWRSFANYLARKMSRSDVVGEDADPEKVLEQHLQGLEKEVEYIADIVPLRKIVCDSEARLSIRKDRDLKRGNVSFRFAVDVQCITLDMGSVFRPLLPDVAVSDCVQEPVVLLTLQNGNRHIDKLNLTGLHAELARCIQPGATYECKRTNQGIEVTVTSTEKSKANQSIGAIISKYVSWRLPMGFSNDILPSAGFLEVHGVETYFIVSGTAAIRKWKRIVKQGFEQPEISPGIRIVDAGHL